jgi:phosphoribosylanthranilate isomerase
MFVKFCGFTRESDVEEAIGCGVNAIGFVFYDNSPRYIVPQKARCLMNLLRGSDTKSVGVFVDDDANRIMRIVEMVGLDYAQVYSVDVMKQLQKYIPAIMAYRVADARDVARAVMPHNGLLLFDSFSKASFGGTGITFNWNGLQHFQHLDATIIAGGLHAGNVGNLLSTIRPFGVDVSSGIEEKPGIKSAEKMKEFMKRIKEALAGETLAK